MTAPAIEFRAGPHTYHLAGRQIPHVTGVLEALERFLGVDPAVLEWAAERGRHVHAACHYLDEGDLHEDSLDSEIRPYVDAYRQFLRDVRPRWTAIEQRVYCPVYQYAGTLDRVGTLMLPGAEGMAVVDLKTVSSLSPVTGLQLAAYDHAYRYTDRRRKPLARYALQLRPDRTYKLKRYDELTDLAVFISQLTVTGWARRNNRTQEIPA